MGPLFPGWYQEDFLGSGLMKPKVSGPEFAGIAHLGQVINGLRLSFLLSKVRITDMLGKIK